jgi:hypothetical protein
MEVVRSYLRLQSLPVVILTALDQSPMIDRAQALKVNTVLIKGKATSGTYRRPRKRQSFARRDSRPSRSCIAFPSAHKVAPPEFSGGASFLRAS